MALNAIKFFDNFNGVWTDAIGSGGDVIVYDDNSGWISSASKGLNFDANQIANGTVSNAEFQRLDGVTSNIQTQLDGKVGTPAWTDYFSSSTIVGTTSNSGVINYFVMGKILFVSFDISGTSSTTAWNFTIPYTTSSYKQYAVGQGLNNTTTQIICNMYNAGGTSVIHLLMNTSNIGSLASWTATGTRQARGIIILNIV